MMKRAASADEHIARLEQRAENDKAVIKELQTKVTELERSVAAWRKSYEFALKQARSAASAANAWEGKFHQVKRENNALRRKVWKLQQEGLVNKEIAAAVELMATREE